MKIETIEDLIRYLEDSSNGWTSDSTNEWEWKFYNGYDLFELLIVYLPKLRQVRLDKYITYNENKNGDRHLYDSTIIKDIKRVVESCNTFVEIVTNKKG